MKRTAAPVTAPPPPRPIPGRRPLCLAHRGASAHAPENTMAAFEEAIRLGVDAIELDVRLSADGIPVVIHDEMLERTTSGRGPVAARTLAEIRKLDAGGWFGSSFQGEQVPTLVEVLDLARGRCGVNVEIKVGRRSNSPVIGRRAREHVARLSTAVARVVARSRFEGLLLISSFSRMALTEARSILPRIPLGLLMKRSGRGLTPAHRRLGLSVLSLHLRLTTSRRILAAHRHGLQVFVWPASTLDDMRRLLALGADGLMSADPALFRNLGPVRLARHTTS